VHADPISDRNPLVVAVGVQLGVSLVTAGMQFGMPLATAVRMLVLAVADGASATDGVSDTDADGYT